MTSKHLPCLLSLIIILVVQILQAQGFGPTLWPLARYSQLPQGVNPNTVHRIELPIRAANDYERLIYQIRNLIGADSNPLRLQNDVLIVRQTYPQGPVESVYTEISYRDVYVRGVDVVSRNGNVISIRYEDYLQDNQYLVEGENDLEEAFIHLNRGRLETYPNGPIPFDSPNAPQNYLNPAQLRNPADGYLRIMHSQAVVLSEAARFDEILSFVKENFDAAGALSITGFLNDLVHSWTKWAAHSSQIRPISAAIVINGNEEFLLSEEEQTQLTEHMMEENEESLFSAEEEFSTALFSEEEQAELLTIGRGEFDKEFLIKHYPSVIKAALGVSVPTRYLPNSNSEVFTTAGDQTGIDVICQIRGDSVKGYFGTSNIWDLVEFAGGIAGYVSNSFVQAPQDDFVTSDCLQGPFVSAEEEFNTVLFSEEEQAELLAIGRGEFDKVFLITHASSVIKAAPGVAIPTRYLPKKDSEVFTTAGDQIGIDIICQIRSDSVFGYYGRSDIWDLVEFAGGIGGYVPNTFAQAPQDQFITSDCLQGPFNVSLLPPYSSVIRAAPDIRVPVRLQPNSDSEILDTVDQRWEPKRFLRLY